jgi:hypothetical protein
VKAIHDKVNSILSTLDLDTNLDGMLHHANVLCVIRYKLRQGNELPLFKEQGKRGGRRGKKKKEG